MMHSGTDNLVSNSLDCSYRRIMELKQSKLWHASQKNPSAIRPISTVRQEIEYSTYYKREDQTRP